MSVERLAKLGDVSARLSVLLPKISGENPAPPVLTPHTSSTDRHLIGIAFDYAVRIELERASGRMDRMKWIAEGAIDNLRSNEFSGLPDVRRIIDRVVARISNAHVFVRKHFVRRKRDDAWMLRLCRHTLKLARMDFLARGGTPDDTLFAVDEDAACQEVAALLAHAPISQWATATPLLLNPTFGEASSRLGGADADIIAGNELIDLKVTKDANVERRMANQVLIYMMLIDEVRSQGLAFPEIQHLAIYFARHRQIWRRPATPIRAHPAYESTKAWLFENAGSLLAFHG
jgi:hypothetical protein